MKNCPKCHYPSEGACTNPACLANPSLSEERKAMMRASAEKRREEEAEREMLRRARQSAMRRDGQR